MILEFHRQDPSARSQNDGQELEMEKLTGKVQSGRKWIDYSIYTNLALSFSISEDIDRQR